MSILVRFHSLIGLVLLIALGASSRIYAQLPDFTDLIQENSPAVVKISILAEISPRGQGNNQDIPPLFRDFFEQFSEPQQRRPAGIGSGFIISEDGYIVTNHHVIDGADQILVRLNDRREYDAEIIGSDARSDLALLKIDETDLPFSEFADPKSIEVGDWVVAIGSPFSLDYSASAGIVSAIGRSLPDGSGQDYVPFIQTDVAINPGNSGGPLLNLKGEVVGINSQIFTRSGGFMGLSFAVPASVALNVIQQLRDTGEVARGWLGVVTQDVDRELAESFGLDKPMGALIARVLRDSPADQAGIKPGDVIVEFDGNLIEFSHDLPHVVGLITPGSDVKVKLIRKTETKTLDVTVAQLDQSGRTRPASGSKSRSDNSDNALGIEVKNAEPDQVAQLQVGGGVEVVSVDSGSPAESAGLREGDIIVQLAFNDLSDVDSFEEALGSLRRGSVVPILFYRGRTAIFRTIQIDE